MILNYLHSYLSFRKLILIKNHRRTYLPMQSNWFGNLKECKPTIKRHAAENQRHSLPTGTSEVGPSSPPVREEMDKSFAESRLAWRENQPSPHHRAMGGSASEAQDTHQVAEWWAIYLHTSPCLLTFLGWVLILREERPLKLNGNVFQIKIFFEIYIVYCKVSTGLSTLFRKIGR